MNVKRRARIDEALKLIGDAAAILDEVMGEEQDAYDNMPESFQNGERGERGQAWIDGLENAVSQLSDIDSELTGLE